MAKTVWEPGEEWFQKEMGRRVAERRKRQHLTLAELGKSANLTRASMCDIEKGRCRVTSYTLARLSDRLLVTPTDIVPA